MLAHKFIYEFHFPFCKIHTSPTNLAAINHASHKKLFATLYVVHKNMDCITVRVNICLSLTMFTLVML